MSVRASKLIQNHESMMSNQDLVARVISSLLKSETFEQAGELYEKTGQNDQAMECYRKGETFARAVELARHYYPNEVVNLEENWGDHLASNKQLDAAINHYRNRDVLMQSSFEPICIRVHEMIAIDFSPFWKRKFL